MYNEKPIIKLFKYENRFIQIAQIDDYESVSWERKLYEAGQFTITINFNIPNAHLFKRGMFVQFGNDPSAFGEIRKIQDTIGADGKGNQKRVITGYDARYIFKRRIISNLNNGDCWQGTGKAEAVMKNLISDQCGINAEEKRKLPVNINLGDVTFLSTGQYTENNVTKDGLLTSYDGKQWDILKSNVGYLNNNSMIFYSQKKKLYIRVSPRALSSVLVYYSKDMVHWENGNIDATEVGSYHTVQTDEIFYNEERDFFVFCGSFMAMFPSRERNNYKAFSCVSSDGINWTMHKIAPDTFDTVPCRITNLSFANGKYYACGTYNVSFESGAFTSGDSVIFESEDCINWAMVYRNTNDCYRAVGVAYFLDKYFICENDTDNLGHSLSTTDFVHFSTEAIPNSSGYFSNIITIDKYLLVSAGRFLAISSDNTSWQRIYNTSVIVKIIYNSNLNLYIMNSENYELYISNDLIEWQKVEGRFYDTCNIDISEMKGKIITVSESYTNLYEVLKTIATNGDIGWRVNFTEDELFFEVYEGTDRSKSVFFDVNMDSLANGSFDDSSDNFANVVYIGGKGEGSERDIYEGESLIDGSSPSAFERFESWSNESEMTKEEEYQAKADGILKEAVKTLSFSGAGLAKSPYQYRKQYDVGDRITVAFSDTKATVQILSVTEHWQKGVYNLTFSFGKTEAELKNQLHTMLRQIQKASSKTNAIDSVKWYEPRNTFAQPKSDVTFNTLGFTGYGLPYVNQMFALYFSADGTGSKSYNIYVKDLLEDITLTTGALNAQNLTLQAGTYVTRIYVDESGNVIKYNFS